MTESQENCHHSYATLFSLNTYRIRPSQYTRSVVLFGCWYNLFLFFSFLFPLRFLYRVLAFGVVALFIFLRFFPTFNFCFFFAIQTCQHFKLISVLFVIWHVSQLLLFSNYAVKLLLLHFALCRTALYCTSPHCNDPRFLWLFFFYSSFSDFL